MSKNNNKVKTIGLLIVWVALLFLIPFSVLMIEKNTNKRNNSYISSDFKIGKYDVVLDVDEDNRIDVTENITMNIPSDDYNGIYKSIPLWEKYYNKDLQESKKKVKITNLRAIGEKFVLSNYNDSIGIKVGSSRTNTNEGLHTYTIKYRYNMGNDNNKNFDELVFNVFDNYDNTQIDNVSVTINMPKDFDSQQILFLKGRENVNDNIDYTINGRSLIVSMNNYSLDDSLTINMVLDDGYFVGTTSNYGFKCLLICIITIIISIISAVSWKKIGKDFDKKSQTVEFYAPDDLDAAQIGYIYGQKDVRKLTIALIIGLASKGYISIQETNKNKYNIINIGKNNSKLKRISITEQLVYQELFKNNDENVLFNDPSFGIVFGKIQECLSNIIDKKVNDLIARKKTNTIFALLFASIIAWTLAYLYIKDLNPNLNIVYFVSFIAIFITGFFSIFMERKTAYGEIIYAKVLGFKDYLYRVEKNQLDYQVKDNPNYFYDILPYTYVLGISEKWVNTFGKNNVPNIDINALSLYEGELFIMMSE
ncbi:MAG: DUF2207 domain-containing protein [Bacilli bacterium]